MKSMIRDSQAYKHPEINILDFKIDLF